MKLKEWGLMRHKPRRATKDRREVRSTSRRSPEEEACDRHSSATPEPMSIDVISREHCTKTGGWQVVADLPTMVAGAGMVAEPTFMGLLSQPQE
jgi:hypothetical protein